MNLSLNFSTKTQRNKISKSQQQIQGLTLFGQTLKVLQLFGGFSEVGLQQISLLSHRGKFVTHSREICIQKVSLFSYSGKLVRLSREICSWDMIWNKSKWMISKCYQKTMKDVHKINGLKLKCFPSAIKQARNFEHSFSKTSCLHYFTLQTETK